MEVRRHPAGISHRPQLSAASTSHPDRRWQPSQPEPGSRPASVSAPTRSQQRFMCHTPADTALLVKWFCQLKQPRAGFTYPHSSQARLCWTETWAAAGLRGSQPRCKAARDWAAPAACPEPQHLQPGWIGPKTLSWQQGLRATDRFESLNPDVCSAAGFVVPPAPPPRWC